MFISILVRFLLKQERTKSWFCKVCHFRNQRVNEHTFFPPQNWENSLFKQRVLLQGSFYSDKLFPVSFAQNCSMIFAPEQKGCFVLSKAKRTTVFHRSMVFRVYKRLKLQVRFSNSIKQRFVVLLFSWLVSNCSVVDKPC